jgi:hypothetical protein
MPWWTMLARALPTGGGRRWNHPHRRQTNDHDARVARQALDALRALYRVKKLAEERRKGFA